MENDHPLLSPKAVAVLALVGGSGYGMSLILANRLGFIGLSICAVCSAGMVSLYWRSVVFAFSTWQWPDDPSPVELSIAVLCSVASILIALYLFLMPEPQPIAPHIPSAQENARAVVSLESQTARISAKLDFHPDLSLPAITFSLPETQTPVLVPAQPPSTAPVLAKIDPFAIGRGAVGKSPVGTITGGILSTDNDGPYATGGIVSIATGQFVPYDQGSAPVALEGRAAVTAYNGPCPHDACPISLLEAYARNNWNFRLMSCSSEDLTYDQETKKCYPNCPSGYVRSTGKCLLINRPAAALPSPAPQGSQQKK